MPRAAPSGAAYGGGVARATDSPTQEFAARVLGVDASEVVAVGTPLSALPFLLAAHALAHDLPECAPTASASTRHEGGATYLPPLDGTERLIPFDGLFALPAGSAADVPFVVRCTSPGMGDRIIEVLCRREDRDKASAYLTFLREDGAAARNPYRGLVCEVRPDRSQLRTAIRIEPVTLPDVARDQLVLPDDVWRAVDENVHQMFAAASLLKGAELGARRGLLIAGPPGVGKSALCRIVAREVSGKATVLLADMSVARHDLEDLYKEAARAAPALVVLEELDGIAGDRRGGGMSTELSQFLAATDGIATPDEVIVTLATTNAPETLDAAALRAARFDRIVRLSLPDLDGRDLTLRRYLRSIVAEGAVDTRAVATVTTGASGSELRELVRLAVLRHGRNVTTEVLRALATETASWRRPPSSGSYL